MTRIVNLKIRLAVVVHSVADRYANDPDIQRLKQLHSEVEISEALNLSVTAAKLSRLREVRRLRDHRHLPFKTIGSKIGVSRQYAGRLYRQIAA